MEKLPNTDPPLSEDQYQIIFRCIEARWPMQLRDSTGLDDEQAIAKSVSDQFGEVMRHAHQLDTEGGDSRMLRIAISASLLGVVGNHSGQREELMTTLSRAMESPDSMMTIEGFDQAQRQHRRDDSRDFQTRSFEVADRVNSAFMQLDRSPITLESQRLGLAIAAYGASAAHDQNFAHQCLDRVRIYSGLPTQQSA